MNFSIDGLSNSYYILIVGNNNRLISDKDQRWFEKK